MSVSIVPFTQDHIEPAAALLAERHRCDRAWAPGLSAMYEGVEAARSALARLVGDGASGVVALRGSRLAGYLLGTREYAAPTDSFAGFVRPRSVDIPYAGHAVESAECGTLHRSLYAALAEQWVSAGVVAHYTTIPVNRVSAEAWLDLGFARFIDMGVFEIARDGDEEIDAGDVAFRLAGPDDEDAVRALTTELFRSFAAPPIFVPFLPETDAARQQFVTEHLGDATCPHWLAFRGGRPVAMLMFEEPTSPHWHQSPLQTPDKSPYLFLACTVPEARSTGVGAALFCRAMVWAREAGYERCAVHYLTSSRAASFWRGLGFQPVSHWMVRQIDERVIWANGEAG